MVPGMVAAALDACIPARPLLAKVLAPGQLEDLTTPWREKRPLAPLLVLKGTYWSKEPARSIHESPDNRKGRAKDIDGKRIFFGFFGFFQFLQGG